MCRSVAIWLVLSCAACGEKPEGGMERALEQGDIPPSGFTPFVPPVAEESAPVTSQATEEVSGSDDGAGSQ